MASHHREPVLGYASKSDAIAALHAEGLTAAEIGVRIGSSAQAVKARIQQLRDRGKLPPSRRQLQVPEAARQRLERMWPAISEVLGEALGVPPAALKVRLIRLSVDAPVAEAGGEPLAPAGPPSEPSREDDEAELARLAAAEQAPPRVALPQVRRSAEAFTRRVMGDPPPGRSALDQRRSEAR